MRYQFHNLAHLLNSFIVGIPPCVEGKAWQIDTASNTSTKQSSVVSRHDVSNNSFCKEGPSPIEKLYSPKRASNLGLHSLNLPVGKTQSDRDKEAHQNLIQLEYSTHKQNQLCSTQRSNSSTECTAKSEILDRSNKTTNNIHDIQMPCRSILDRTKSYDEVNMSSAHAEGTAKEAFDDCQAIYIETFDIMLSDINGPLGKGCGGLRRYFYKLLENIVSTGCIYRTANKIGICVHGTVKSLGIVRSVLEHASQGSISGVTWKFRSTGRSLRHGQWKKMFTTKLCENAASGRYSPQKNSLLMQNKIIGRMK